MVTLLLGQNKSQSKKILSEIKTKIIIFNDQNFDIDSFQKTATTKDIFETQKTILLKNCLEKTKKEDLKKFESILKKIISSKNTNIIIEENKIDKRSTLYKLIKKSGTITELKPPTDLEIQNYIKTKFQQNNISASPNLIQTIAFKTKDSTEHTKNEVEKIITFIGKDNTLTPELLDQISIKTQEENIFQFLEHIAHKRKSQALDFFMSEIKSNNNAPYLVYMIANQNRNMLIFKDEAQRNIPQNQSALKIHPFARQKTVALTNKFSMPELISLHRKILILDKNIKSYSNPKKAFVEFLSQI